tara:strand:+ start:655 stop:1563 length:909 start_codon:yes stop_codon:yes gene_type:complete
MSAELVDINQEFELGNMFTLDAAKELASLLSDEYRIIVKYDLGQEMPYYNDEKFNIVFATSRETHNVPNEFYRKDVFAIFQHYFMLDRWGYPMYNPLAYPLPLGPFRDLEHLEIKPIPERKYDFSFIGQIPDTGTRDCFERNLNKLIEEKGDKYEFYVKYTDGFSQGLSPEEYLNILGETKISLCPAGAHSNETFRFFESIIMGSIPLVETLPRLWYYEEAPHFSAPWRSLDSTLSKLLNFLQTPSCRSMLYKIATYCTQTLSPQGLAQHLREKIEFRRQNFLQHEPMLDNFRKELNELDTF